MKKFIVILICFMCLLGCDSKSEEILYNTISSEDAYNIIKSSENIVILDVRTISEYESGHIKDAVNVPLDGIEEEIGQVISDKETKILVYCQSGGRSKLASEKLANMGYTNINNFGGLNTWNYEIVTE